LIASPSALPVAATASACACPFWRVAIAFASAASLTRFASA
jgi:hypothetical protein